MGLEQVGEIDLPPHVTAGGFDHAAVHAARNRLYVAHTANDAVDIIDGTTDRYAGSIPALSGVAGVLVSEERDLVFTSNRGDDTDPHRTRLQGANVGDPWTRGVLERFDG